MREQIKRFIERPYWQQVLFLLSLFSTLAVIYYFLIIDRIVMQHDVLWQQAQQLHFKTTQIQQQINRLQQQNTTYKIQQQPIWEVDKPFNIHRVERDLMVLVATHFKQINTFKSISSELNHDRYLSWQIVVTGQYSQLLAFLTALYQPDYLFIPSFLEIVKTQQHLILELRIVFPFMDKM